MTRGLSVLLALFVAVTIAFSIPSFDADAKGGNNGNPPSHAAAKGHGKPKSTGPPKHAHAGGRSNNPPKNITPNPPRHANNKPKVVIKPRPQAPKAQPQPTREAQNNRSEPRPPAPKTQAPERLVDVPEPIIKQEAKAKKKKKKRSRQDLRRCVRIVPDDGWINLPPVSLSKPEVAGIGTFTLLALMVLIMFGMWLGYYLGYKDSDKADAKFLRSLLGK